MKTLKPNSDSSYPFATTSRRTCARPPDFHKEGYVVEINGQCLEPVLFHGELIAAEPIVPEAGEFACFFFKGSERGSVKLNAKPIHGFPMAPKSELIPLIEAMQFNPTQHYSSWASELVAIHRVTWVMRDGKWQPVNQLLKAFDWRALLRPGVRMPAKSPNVGMVRAVQS